MRSRPTATLVVTTIFDPKTLDQYYKNFGDFGHVDEVEVVIIPDRNTSRAAYARAQSLNDRGLKTSCPTPDDQEEFLRSVGFPPELTPYNSDNRRNVGFLLALASGSDFLISIDDDNYCTREEDFFAEHAVVCREGCEHTVAASATRFLNICDLLELDKPAPVYPRGFPYYARHKEENPKLNRESPAVHMNAGLWTLDPDIDGITWLVTLPHVRAFKGMSVVLARDTWSPVNTQNTALRRDVIPSYYFVKMSYPIMGMPIDRYGDIFSGYFAQACIKHLGGAIRVGTPVTEHKRNSHDYFKDAANEWSCILVLEDLLPWLQEARICGGTYPEAYESLSYIMEDAVERFHGMVWTDVTRGYFHQVGYHMRAWLKACRHILGTPEPPQMIGTDAGSEAKRCSDMRISALMPVFSETNLLLESIRRVKAALGGWLHEIVIAVSPRSSPECLELCRCLHESEPLVKTFMQSDRPGIGWAYRESIPYMTGTHALIIASDLETDPDDAGRMAQTALDTDADIVCASRWLPGGGFTGYNPIKLVLNYGYNLLFRTLYGISIHDLTFGYRLMKAEVLRQVKWEYGGHEFCAETLLKPVRLGYRAVEIPTKWVKRPEGQSKNSFSRNLKFAVAAWRIRLAPKASFLAER